MTAEAALCSLDAHPPAQRTFHALRLFSRLSGGNVQRLSLCEKTQTALKVGGVFLEDICLSILESESPNRGQGGSIESFSHAESRPFGRSFDIGAETTF